MNEGAARSGAPQERVAVPFHRRYLLLVEEIERRFPVTRWRSGDLDIWPLARMDLYLDMYWSNAGGSMPRVRPLPLPLRVVTRAATPLTDLWKSRHDLSHWVSRPKPAHAIVLGDGVSLDCIDGEWHDRYAEPVIAALEKRGLRTFLMQSGDLSTLPWHRPTYAANIIAARGSLGRFAAAKPCELPGHEGVMQFLQRNAVPAPRFGRAQLEQRANVVLATAAAFERVLGVVKPTLAFVVTYYADLGPAFLLACRRRGILSIDLQHCPQAGAHKAYGWPVLPEKGYSTLPAVFWNWTEEDAAYIQRWASKLPSPWHRGLHGGHTQMAAFLDGSATAETWDAKFNALSHSVGHGTHYEREVLIALQPVGGYRAQWDALAAQIESAPATWRWWIRRHPSARPYQDVEYKRLVSLRMPNVVVDQSLSLPLPVLLRHASVLISRFSGASVEALAFGVPVLFLSEEARGQFSSLIDSQLASIVDVRKLNAEIARVAPVPVRPRPVRQPGIDGTLSRLQGIARDYAHLCASDLRSCAAVTSA
jgi:hypothetical protein